MDLEGRSLEVRQSIFPRVEEGSEIVPPERDSASFLRFLSGTLRIDEMIRNDSSGLASGGLIRRKARIDTAV